MEVLIQDAQSGFGNFEKLVMDILDLISLIPKSVIKCEISKAELDIIASWTVPLRNMTIMGSKLFYAFLQYPDRIKADVKELMDGVKTGNYSASGFGLGDILHVFFVDLNQTTTDNIFDEVVKFLEGFYAKAFNIKLDLDTCDADVDKAWADVKNAILEMEKFTLADIEQGLVDLYKAMPELVTAFQVCETAWPDIEKGFEKLKVFRDHAAYIPVAVTKAVSLHPIRTTQDSWAAYKAFTSVPADYKVGGEASGDMLELIIEEMGADESVVQILLKN